MPEILRHFVATLDYRCKKAIQDAPPDYPTLKVGYGVRTPVEILSHIHFGLRYAISVLADVERLNVEPGSWEEEKLRFNQAISELDRLLSQPVQAAEETYERLLQGPLSDAMTHVGQLALLRRMAGSPIPHEVFFDADIRKRELE